MLATKRQFLRLSAAAGAALFVPAVWQQARLPGAPALGHAHAAPAAPARPLNLRKYVDPLPVPGALTPDTTTIPGTDLYQVAMTQFPQQLHAQLPPTAVWGYGGSYPGPTIEGRSGRPVRVEWVNSLPTTHLLQAAIDPTIPDPAMHPGLPDVRTVVHLHGGFVPPQSDGHPMGYFVPGGSAIYDYPNAQAATTLWYHDHAMGITRLNVYAGLAGFYLLRDAVEDALNVPRGAYEVPLVIQDRMFNRDGSLLYPNVGVTAAHPVWSPEFFGDVPLVNGKAYPFLDVEPRRYRFRILNGSQSRFYNLWLSGSPGAVPFWQIGSDGGLLPAPVALNRLLIAPGERADVVVDFSGFANGSVLTLSNNARAPYPGGAPGKLPQIMQFRVVRPLAGADTTTPPGQLVLPAISRLTPTPGLPSREVVLREYMDMTAGAPTHAWLNGYAFGDPVTEQPVAGTTEVWEFVNTTGDAHPMHLHLVQFQVVNRQPFDAARYAADWDAWVAGGRNPATKPVLANYLLGPAVLPPAEEAGWKDTAKAYPGEVLRVVARFDIAPGTVLPAAYVYHCHILEHEDNEMMRPFEVVP